VTLFAVKAAFFVGLDECGRGTTKPDDQGRGRVYKKKGFQGMALRPGDPAQTNRRNRVREWQICLTAGRNHLLSAHSISSGCLVGFCFLLCRKMSQIAVNTLRKHCGGYSRKRTVQVPRVTFLCCKRMRNIITP